MMARFGSILAPIINSIGDKKNDELPFLIFGISAVFTSVISLFVLPETFGRPLPETIKDAEKLKNFL